MKPEIQKLIAEDKLMELLGGFPNYRTLNPYAEVPTYPDTVLKELGDFLASGPEARLKFVDALEKLSKDLEYGWVSTYYLNINERMEKTFGFTLISDDTIKKVGENLYENREFHKSNREWLGADYEDGIWGAVKRMDKMLTERYGIKVLPIEAR